MNKKTIPLKLFEIVEAFIKDNESFLTATSDGAHYYIIKDKDHASNYSFKILREPPSGTNNGAGEIFIKKTPASIIETHEHYIATTYQHLKSTLDHWAGIIKKFDNTKSVLDDPILKAYQEEFYDEYKIIEDDAEYAPFNSQRLLYIDEYLGSITGNIDKYKDLSNSEKIDEIKSDAELLRNELTTLSKNKVILKLSRIWAKMQKQGIKLIKEFVKDGKKEIFKLIIKKAIAHFTDTDTISIE